MNETPRASYNSIIRYLNDKAARVVERGRRAPESEKVVLREEYEILRTTIDLVSTVRDMNTESEHWLNNPPVPEPTNKVL